LCVPSQNGLLLDPPQRHNAARSPSNRTLPSASTTRTPPLTRYGPFADAHTSVGPVVRGTEPGRRVRSAPDGHRATAASTSSAVAASTAIHGRRLSSKTRGRARTQLAEWKQSRGSHSTTISSVAYSFVSRSRVELLIR
jgi:hypothetical protein